MVVDPTAGALWNALETLARDLAASELRMPGDDRGRAVVARDAVVGDVRHYLTPRLRAPDAPVVVGVTGPTGAGSSTIVNSLAGAGVSPTGVVRPTTHRPVAWATGSHGGHWWADLLERIGDAEDAAGSLADRDHPSGFALVDVPAGAGPERTLEWVAAVDLCVFVTTPGRYADAEAAALLGSIHDRGIPVIHVMNRLPTDVSTAGELLAGYSELLQMWGLLDASDGVAIVTVAAGVPPDVTDLASRLAELGTDAGRRAAVVKAVRSRLRSVGRRARDVGELIEEDRDLMVEFRGAVAEAYDRQEEILAADLNEGRLGHLARHQSWTEAAVDLTGILTRRAGLAAQDAAAAWWVRVEGRTLLGAGGSLRRHGPDTAYEGQGMLESWIGELGDVAGSAAARPRSGRRTKARLARWAWPLVVDADRPVPRPLRRRLGDQVEVVVGEGRDRLDATIRAILEHDAARFDDFLGALPDVAGLGRIFTAAAVVASAAEGTLDLSRPYGDENTVDLPTDEGSPVAAADTPSQPADGDGRGEESHEPADRKVGSEVGEPSGAGEPTPAPGEGGREGGPHTVVDLTDIAGDDPLPDSALSDDAIAESPGA